MIRPESRPVEPDAFRWLVRMRPISRALATGDYLRAARVLRNGFIADSAPADTGRELALAALVELAPELAARVRH